MKFSVNLTTATPRNLRTLRKWGGVMTQDTFSATQRGNVGQFGLINVMRIDSNGRFYDWGGNSGSVKLSVDLVRNIAELQEKPNVNGKMGWLTYGGTGSGWGAPMQCTGDWYIATDTRMIAAVYAGQQVEILENKIMPVEWNGKKEVVNMCRVRDFLPSEWAADNMMLVSTVTADDGYGEMPNPTIGRVKLPVYFGGFSGWVMERWLV